MLAIGKGYISFDMLIEMFDLPKDAFITQIEVERNGVTFYMLSKDEVEGKFHKTYDFENIRVFPLKEKNEEYYAVRETIDSYRKQGENHDS